MRIVFLTDGDGTDLAHGLAALLSDDDTLDVVVPVTRDHWTHGLKCCPDVDAFLTLPRDDIAAPTFTVADELAAVGFSPSWVRPSDAEIARQIQRTELLQAGYTLGAATTAMAARVSLPFGLLPASDDRAELHVVVEEPDGRRAVHVAEYLAEPQAHRPVEATIVTASWEVSAAVREVVGNADVILLGPSSPVLSLDPLLVTPGLGDAMTAPQADVPRRRGRHPRSRARCRRGRPMTLDRLLAGLPDPASPFLTYYDDGTGERVELSGVTTANWVAKTSNFLVDDLEAEPGTRVRLGLPSHWLRFVWMLSCWSVGAAVVESDADIGLSGPDLVADEPVRVAASLRPLGGRFAEPPAGFLDIGAEVPPHGDVFVPIDPSRPRTPWPSTSTAAARRMPSWPRRPSRRTSDCSSSPARCAATSTCWWPPVSAAARWWSSPTLRRRTIGRLAEQERAQVAVRRSTRLVRSARPPAREGLPRMSLAEYAAREGLHKVGGRPPIGAYLVDVWQRRAFIYSLARFRIEAENGRNRLGMGWVVLKPLINAAVYGTIFGILLGRRSRPDQFVLFLVIGVFFFEYFSSCFTSGAKSITKQRQPGAEPELPPHVAAARPGDPAPAAVRPDDRDHDRAGPGLRQPAAVGLAPADPAGRPVHGVQHRADAHHGATDGALPRPDPAAARSSRGSSSTRRASSSASSDGSARTRR